MELLGAEAKGRSAIVTGRVVDKLSRIVAIHYSVDSADEWTALLSDDGICDSQKEQFSFEVNDLQAGPHRIAVKVEDVYGNVGYQAVTVTVADQGG